MTDPTIALGGSCLTWVMPGFGSLVESGPIDYANETRSNWTRSIFSVPMRHVSVGRVPMRRVPNRRVYISADIFTQLPFL